MKSSDWIKICGRDGRALAAEFSAEVQNKISRKLFKPEDVLFVSKLRALPGIENLSIPENVLEKIRRACQLWDVDFRHQNISSHRRYLGPFIVGAKKIIFPIIRVLLKDVIRQQRDFNGAVVAALTEIGGSRGQPPTA